MEQSNIGFCHFEPSLTGFVGDMECQVSGDAGQRPTGVSNITGNTGISQQSLNSMFENSDFSNENHFDHHHHPNFPATSTQFFMPSEMFGMSSSSNSSVFNFPAPSFLSQADLSRVYPFIQRGTTMPGLLGSTMDPHHHHHHHPHLPHQLTHPIFPMHRFPDLLNANPEVLPALNFHSDIRGPASFFKPAMQFSVQTGHHQQQNILKLPTLPISTTTSTPSTPSLSSSSSSLPTSSTIMSIKSNEIPLSLSTGPCDSAVVRTTLNSPMVQTRQEIHRTVGDAVMSSPILKFSENNKMFPNDFMNFPKPLNSSGVQSNSSLMNVAPPTVEKNKLSSNIHLRQPTDFNLQPVGSPDEETSKSRKLSKPSKQKKINNNGLNEACINQILSNQNVTTDNELNCRTDNDFNETDKNVDIVNTILQLVNEEKTENVGQNDSLTDISIGQQGDGQKEVDGQLYGPEGHLQDSDVGILDGAQQLRAILPQQTTVSIKIDSLVQVEESQCIMVDNQKRWKCSQCPKMYSTKHNLITHMLGHKGIKPHFCSLCGKYFKQVSHLHTHMLTHGKIKPHTCPVCLRSFTQSCHVKRHMVIHQQDKTHACNICGRNFAYPNDLKKHLLKHEESKNGQETAEDQKTTTHTRRHYSSLRCEQCQLNFESKDKLLNHRALEHRDTYACAECDKVFAYPSQLKHHASKHNNIRPYICRECGENFMKEHHLKAHMFTHTGLKPYDCATCGRAFNQKANLRRHTLIHEAQKKFSCDVCGKMFTQLQILRAHLITHREQKPFQCKICDKRFSRLHNLNGHMHLHGGERPYVCSCGSSFTLKGNLNRHKKDKNCQPIEMIELDEIDTKPIFDAIAVESVTMDADKMATSSGEDRKESLDGSKKKRKSVPRKNITQETSGDSESKKEEEETNDPSTWPTKRDDDDDDDGNRGDGTRENASTQQQQQNNFIELLSVKEYLFDKSDDNENEKFNPSNFPFTGVMYNHESSADQSMQFLSFTSESTDCSLGVANSLAGRGIANSLEGRGIANSLEGRGIANSLEGRGIANSLEGRGDSKEARNDQNSDENGEKDLSTTDDDYEYDDNNIMNDDKVRSMDLS